MLCRTLVRKVVSEESGGVGGITANQRTPTVSPSNMYCACWRRRKRMRMDMRTQHLGLRRRSFGGALYPSSPPWTYAPLWRASIWAYLLCSWVGRSNGAIVVLQSFVSTKYFLMPFEKAVFGEEGSRLKLPRAWRCGVWTWRCTAMVLLALADTIQSCLCIYTSAMILRSKCSSHVDIHGLHTTSIRQGIEMEPR
jgi:hypothetical protein